MGSTEEKNNRSFKQVIMEFDFKFTQKDWDYIMETHPRLRKQYEEMIEFNKTNPYLAEEIDNECKKIINGKEN